MRNKINEKYEYNNFKKIIETVTSLREACEKLGIGLTSCNKITVKKYIDMYNIPTLHFFRKNAQGVKVLKLEEILIKNSNYSRIHVKEKLYNEGLKERTCEICGQNEYWNGKKMSLILDHINGIYNDNRLENLRIVCPNCNATLDTHCKGNYVDTKKEIKVKEKKYCNCGEEIAVTSKKCRKCSHISLRTKERPSYLQLLDDYELYGYSGTGKKYGVMDNTIKRWIKSYEKELRSDSD
jgi:hypothetical protein